MSQVSKIEEFKEFALRYRDLKKKLVHRDGIARYGIGSLSLVQWYPSRKFELLFVEEGDAGMWAFDIASGIRHRIWPTISKSNGLPRTMYCRVFGRDEHPPDLKITIYAIAAIYTHFHGESFLP